MQRKSLERFTDTVVLACVVSSVALANGVVIVGRSPIVAYPTIQAAVDAAVDGDALLVAGGNYGGFTIVNKSLAVFAAPHATVQLDGPIEVLDLSSSRFVVLDGLDQWIPPNSPIVGSAPGLKLFNDGGDVRVQHCALSGTIQGPTTVQGPGVSCVAAQHVAISHCTVWGGSGYAAGGSGVGLFVQSSQVLLDHCQVFGADGWSLANQGASGWEGCKVASGTLFAAGSSIRGGYGGEPSNDPYGPGGDGGTGLYVLAGATALLLDDTLAGGAPGCGPMGLCGQMGSSLIAAGSVVSYPGVSRSFDTTQTVLGDDASSSVSISGVAGDRVWTPTAQRPGWAFEPNFAGYWLIQIPVPMTHAPLGTISNSGSLTATLPGTTVATSTSHALVLRQGFVIDAQGAQKLAGPMVQLVLRKASAPDCNGNGVIDYFDVLEGASNDTNSNLVPDECESIPIWYVDASAAAGGDGSQAAPFQTIQQGMSAAASGEVVSVADGVYVGAANRNLDFAGKDLTIRSRNGAANCIVDCQSSGRAFLLVTNETKIARIQGLTIHNGDSSSSPDPSHGGAIDVFGASPVIVDCVFENCRASNVGAGGAIWTNGGSPLIDGCTFEQNGGISNYGGAIDISGSARIRHSTFTSNTANRGGAILVEPSGTTSATLVAGCTFTTNSAVQGGAIAQLGSTHVLAVDDCLFVGNQAGFGGALYSEGVANITDCTASANSATSFGGAIYSTHSTIANSILWNDSAGVAGGEIAIYGTTTVGYCDVQGGQAAVGIGGGGSLVWNAGNIALDPKFVDPDGPDNDPNTFLDNVYRLQASSRCIDAGDNNSIPSDGADIDGDGDLNEFVPLDLNLKPRRKDLPGAPDTGNGTAPIVDIGCYERQS